MTPDLRDRLDDLVAGVPDHVVADPRSAWRAGSRRRTRRRALVVAAAVAAVAVLSGGITASVRLAEPDPAGGEKVPWWTVSSHPSRIDVPLREHDLAGMGNGVAGVVARPDGWYAVTPGGELRRIVGAQDTSYLPSISPDGTKITVVFAAAVEVTTGSDTTGSVTSDVLPGLRMLAGDGDEFGDFSPGYDVGLKKGNRYSIVPHTQVLWSPDSRDLLVPVRYRKDAAVEAIILSGPGVPVHVTVPAGAPDALLVGWILREETSPGGSTVERSELGWLDWGHTEPLGGDVEHPSPRLLVTSTEGGEVLRTVPLASGAGSEVVTATLSSSGDGRLAVTTEAGSQTFDADGRLVSETSGLPRGSVDRCPVSWSGSRPYWPVSSALADADSAPAHDALLDAADPGDPLVQADPRAEIGCSVWAAQALSGPGNRGLAGLLLGHSAGWWSWHWRESALVLFLAVAAAGLGLWWRRRSRTPWVVARSKT